MATTIYYLEQRHAAQLNAKAAPSEAAKVRECRHHSYPLNRFFYHYVGERWQWTDKQQWHDAQWQAYAERDNLRLFILYWQETPAGYFELEKHPDDSVEIAYLGVAPAFLSCQLGGYLLTQALQQAWRWQASRVWVHTCSDDHPHALANYQARGMSIYQVVNPA